MSEEFIPIFETVVSQVLSGDQTQMKNAQQSLNSLKDNPNSLFALLAVINQSQSQTSRQYASIIIRKLIRVHKETLTPEFQMQLFVPLSQAIKNEQSFVNRCNICDILTDMSISPEELINLSSQLIQLNFLSTSFYLLYNFFYTLEYPQKEALSLQLYPICVSSLTNDDPEVRIQSSLFLQLLITEVPDSPAIVGNAEFAQIIEFKAANLANIPNMSQREATELFNLIGCVIHNALPCFIERHVGFAQFTSAFIIQQSIDPYIRYAAIEALSNLFEITIDSLVPILPAIFQNCLIFSVELSTIDQGSEDYTFIGNLIDIISTSIEPEVYFAPFFQLICGLISTQNEMSQRVAIYALSSLILPIGDFIYNEDYIDQIIEIIITELNCPSLIIINETGDLVSSLCEAIPTEISDYVDDIFRLLLGHVNLPKCFRALIDLLSCTTEPPTDLEAAIQFVIDLIPKSSKETHESLVLLLSNLLYNYENINEGIYQVLSPIIGGLLSGDLNQRGLAIIVFGDLVRICPRSVVSDLNNFLPIILQSFTNDDFETNQNCCICILHICEFQAQYLIPSLETIFNALDIILQMKSANIKVEDDENDEFDNSEEDTDTKETILFASFHKMQIIALQCLATLCSNLPQYTSAHFERILNITNDIISGIYYSNEAIQTLSLLANGYKAMNIDPSPIFQIIFQQISIPNEIQNCCAAWQTLDELIQLFGLPLINVYIDSIHQELLNVFLHKKNIYNQKGDKSEILWEIQNSVFSILETIVETLKDNSEKYLEDIVKSLLELMQNPKKKSYSKAIHSLIIISTNVTRFNELFTVALNPTINNLKHKSNSIKTLTISTLNIALHYNPNSLLPIKDNLINYLWEIISKVINGNKEFSPLAEEAFALWFSMVQIYQINVNLDVLESVWEAAYFTTNSEVLKYVANFAVLCGQFQSEKIRTNLIIFAITVFASNENIIRKVAPDALRFLAALVTSATQEQIAEQLSFNSASITRLQNNLAALQN
ncbi:hypothetical protein GPJ56_000180 [Histomonas meleagridis]|uniref:uncharacterized protein n=1 Tax=Histomonas meleagridis TaxID=135588 RepID=UPI003559EDFF|nr:hypothetical protein GPJ56_000180 [Histomonas meleagridis]KAH0806594.1 hypothetical protein GO595_000756 [Histomonas meleagridis]